MGRIAFLILGLLPLSLAAQPSGRGAVLYGSVLSDPNDRRLPGAEVTLGQSLTARTDSAGDFIINAVPPGVYRVLVRHIGNAPISTILNFAPGDSLGRDFVLALDVTQLDTVHVVAKPGSEFITSGKMAGFEMRSKSGFGRFVDARRLEEEHTRRLSDIIRSRSEVRVMDLGTVTSLMARNGIGKGTGARRLGAVAPSCYSQIFIDGVKVYEPNPGQLPFDINSISADALQGIEMYNSYATTPAQYSGAGARCGTILLWMK